MLDQTPPTDITAEWTVHAQLTISRGEQQSKTSENLSTTNEPSAATNEPEASGSKGAPVRVVYKWSSDDLKAAGCHRQNSLGAQDRKKTGNSNSCCRNRAVSSEPTFQPQCRSTCNIVLTACTDLYPTLVPGNDPTYNTTATCTVLPTTTTDDLCNDQTTKCLSFKDAFSQTSDPESKVDHAARPQLQRSRSRRAYDYRRATTEGTAQMHASTNYLTPNVSFEEGSTASPLWRHPSHSPVQIRQVSPSTARTVSPHSAGRRKSGATSATATSKPNKKAPRTVHIDVYCTGSEAEDDDSFSADSISPSTSLSSLDLAGTAQHRRQHGVRSTAAQRTQQQQQQQFDDDEAASNSTPQTVFTAQQMRLHHSRRNSRQTLPRRIVNQMMLLDRASVPYPTQPGQLRQFILDQTNDKDEINVSKMMLFDKHMGETSVTTATVTMPPSPTTTASTSAGVQLSADCSPVTSRKFSFARYAQAAVVDSIGDGDYSSTYPNSSRSTMRDPNWSSLSSTMASSSAVFEDLESYAPIVASSNLSTADSFEYESHVDRARIRDMEQVWMNPAGCASGSSGGKGWRSPEKERKFMLLQQKRLGVSPHENRTMAELTEDGEENVKQTERSVDQRKAASMDVNRFYMRQNAVESEQPETPEDHVPTHNPAPRPPGKLVHDVSNVFRNHKLMTRFGERIEMTRKRHFGPAKNPDCPCDHCRLFAAERKAAKQVRGRALSMGDETMAAALRSTTFWASRPRME